MMSQRATLVFDSAKTASLIDARSVFASDRSLLFTTDALAIDMVICAAEEDLVVVHGQVIDDKSESPIAGAWVRLGENGEPVETDAFGQFAISTATPLEGQTLRVDTGTDEIGCPLPKAK